MKNRWTIGISWGRNGNPLQYSCLENPKDRGAWWATVHGVTKSQMRLSDWAQLLSDSVERDNWPYLPVGGYDSKKQAGFPGRTPQTSDTRGSKCFWRQEGKGRHWGCLYSITLPPIQKLLLWGRWQNICWLEPGLVRGWEGPGERTGKNTGDFNENPHNDFYKLKPLPSQAPYKPETTGLLWGQTHLPQNFWSLPWDSQIPIQLDPSWSQKASSPICAQCQMPQIANHLLE